MECGRLKEDSSRPLIVVSRCLGFGRCRWNGAELFPETVAGLKTGLRFIPVCPECEIGLGVPRQPIRQVVSGNAVRLLQPASGRDLTREMENFSRSFLAGLPPVAGFLLKSRSPSCGITDTALFADRNDTEPLEGKNGPGFFARAVIERFPSLPLIDERGLEEQETRLNWLREVGARKNSEFK